MLAPWRRQPQPNIIRRRDTEDEVPVCSETSPQLEMSNAIVVNGVLKTLRSTTPPEIYDYVMQPTPAYIEEPEMEEIIEKTPPFAPPAERARNGRTKPPIQLNVFGQCRSEEVESYPCKYCENRVFLTASGLLKHTSEVHPNDINEVKTECARIANEWKRREKEKAKSKNRDAAFSAYVKRSAVEKVIERQARLGQAFEHFEQPSVVNMDDKFERCSRCEILINQSSSGAMDSHLRAHAKNDELRTRLLQELGTESVDRLICNDCQLVFTDEAKLRAHNVANHLKKRKYTCKYCGSVCSSIAELNVHKHEQHKDGAPKKALRKKPYTISSVPLGVQNPALRQAHLDSTHQYEPIVCTRCPECSLAIVRPSLLIKHMKRVHNLYNFKALIEMRDVTAYEIRVCNGRLLWVCCSAEYADRESFSIHRRDCHPPPCAIVQRPIEPPQPPPQNMEQYPIEQDAALTGELIQNPDGTMHVVLPNNLADDQPYSIMIMNEMPQIGADQQPVIQDEEYGMQEYDDRDFYGMANENVLEFEKSGDMNQPLNEPYITMTQSEWDMLREQSASDEPRPDGRLSPTQVYVLFDS